MKAHVAKPTKPTTGIKMPRQHKAQTLSTPPKLHTAKVPTAKRTTSVPALKLPTIPEHREKLAGMAPSAPKKGKS